MKKDLFYAFLGGAIAGSVVALLFAPESGKETRERIGEGVKRGRQKMGDMYDSLHQEYNQKREEALEAIESAKNKFKSIKGEVNEDVMEAINCAKAEYEAVGAKLDKAIKSK